MVPKGRNGNGNGNGPAAKMPMQIPELGNLLINSTGFWARSRSPEWDIKWLNGWGYQVPRIIRAGPRVSALACACASLWFSAVVHNPRGGRREISILVAEEFLNEVPRFRSALVRVWLVDAFHLNVFRFKPNKQKNLSSSSIRPRYRSVSFLL